jgi:uncharacterized repeat protein (TIGR03803 family)
MLSSKIAPATLIALVVMLLTAPAAWGQYTEKILWSFTGYGDGGMGAAPTYESLIFDSSGNLYGTTTSGGTGGDGGIGGNGVVIKLIPTSSGPWTPDPLHPFAGGDEGSSPLFGVTFDSAGNLYGANESDGADGQGTVYKLTPAGTFTVIYTFTGGADGGAPHTPLVFDAAGNLYGTTYQGGLSFGTVFKLTPTASGPWTETTLYTFTGGADGGQPWAGIILDSSGNLYGTTSGYGSAGNGGVVFKLTKAASAPWTETLLYTFTGGNDGSGPLADVTFDSSGNLYGTTVGGGSGARGVVFKLTAAPTAPWAETVLYAATGSSFGQLHANVIFDSFGNLYTTSAYGGSANCGTVGCGFVFRLTPTASGPWTANVLYSFLQTDPDAASAYPVGGVVFDSAGNLYGTTTDREGLVYELVAPTFVSTTTSLASSENPSSFGQAVSFTATITPAGPPTQTGTVAFASHGVAIPGCSGLALSSSDTASCTTAALAIGTDAIEAIYTGDSNYHGSISSTLSQVVDPAATVTAVASNLNPSTSGRTVTFTATVSGGFSPTGTVKFDANGATISGCLSVTLSLGAAQCTTATLSAGSDAITATYSGDTNNAGGSGALTQVVNSSTQTATTTSMVSSLNPSTSEQSVTLTATVAPAGPPTPAGTVGFTSLGTAIGGCSAVTLSGSRTATCTTSALAVGTDAIVATYSGDSQYGGSIGIFSQLVNPVPTAVQFVPVMPCRVVDTRNPDGLFGGPAISGGTFRTFAISGSPCTGIPATATAYSLNVTVVPPGPLGYLTIWPAGEGQPAVSTLNSLDGRVKANAAIVPAGSGGAVTVYANNTTNVLLDINGYFETSNSSTLQFFPLTPCRVVDTRKAAGPLGGPSLVAATERDFPILSSTCSVPSTAMAYSLNFTAVPPATGDALEYLTVWPEGETQPVVSTLNNFTGTIVANAAIVPAGTSGGVAVYPSDATNLLIDVNGYFATPGTGGYSLYTVTPCRVLDTRKTTGAFTGALTVNVVGSPCAPPSAAQAYVFNATVLPSGDLGYLTLWPDSETQPVVSTLNAVDGAITSNMAIVPNKDGKTAAYASGTTQLVLDISAYFAP